MKNTMHSIIALILTVLLLASMCGCIAVAEGAEPERAESSGNGATGAVDTIMTAGTTQAFSNDPVPEEDIRTILLAGLAAESAMNQQPWFLVAITDKDVMTEISGSTGMFGAGSASSSGTAPEGGAPQAGDASSSGTAPEGEPQQGGDASSSGTAPEGAPPQGGDASSSGTMPDAPQGETGSGDQKGNAPGSRGGNGGKASLGDSPLAIIIYMNEKTSSGTAAFDCGLAAQNMYIAAASLGYGVKIVSSPTGSLNGGNHDQICEKLGVDPALKAVAVLLIGKPDTAVDGISGATTRAGLDEKANIVG